MDYMVVGSDGKEYGPASVDTLKQWAAENRLTPQSQLRDFSSGQLVLASAVPGLFATAPAPAAAMAGPQAPQMGTEWSQPPTPNTAYARPMPNAKPYYGQDDGKGELIGSIIRSVLAIIFFFVLHGIGVIFGIYAVIYGFQAMQKGHKYGVVALVISCVAMAAIVIGWFLRMQGTGI